MDFKDISDKDLAAAIKKLQEKRNKPAETLEALRQKIYWANQELEEAGQLVLSSDQRLRLLEQAAVLREETPEGDQTRDRLRLALYCELAAREDNSDLMAEKIGLKVKEIQARLMANCSHVVVVGHESYEYGSVKRETGGHMVCVYCGLSEVEGTHGFVKLGPSVGRTFRYRCYREPDPAA